MIKTTGILALTTVMVFSMLNINCSPGMSGEELKESIEVVDVYTRWEEKYYQPWPPKLTIAPAISFKVKNTGDEPLTYIYFNGIFRFKGDPENLGDNFIAGIRGEPVLPGETSETITLQSHFGVEGNSIDHFRGNPEWKTVSVRLFAKSKGSQYVLLGEYEVSREINFEEPEEVGRTETPEKKK
ncbi:MAG: hypothetical protein R6V02_07730 [Candidatus Aminicenantes bacterium]